MRKTVILFALLVIAIAGCARRYVMHSMPLIQEVKTERYTVAIRPVVDPKWKYIDSFDLVVTNETDANIEVDWNKTFYVFNGQTQGNFMFDGIIYKDRNNPKPPDVIFAGGVLQKRIYPNIYVRLIKMAYGVKWVHSELREGENGVYLVMRVDGREVSEKLTTIISKETL